MLLTLGIAAIIGTGACLLLSDDNSNKLCSHSELNDVKGNGIMCSKNIRLSVKQSNEHILMVAPSGSGKSRRFIMPNVNNLKNCSVVITDPSCEIEKNCKTNKNKIVFNPFSNNSIGYDPLVCCKSEFEVRKMAQVILLNGMKTSGESTSNYQEWIAMATPLLTSYMLYSYYTHKYSFDRVIKNVCTMPIFPIKNEKVLSIYQEIMDSEVESAKVELNSFIQVAGAMQTLSSIRSVLNSSLQLFLDNGLYNIFNKQSIDFHQIRNQETVVYIQVPEHYSDYFAPLTATFLTQMLDTLLETSGLQTYFLFDEFTNIGIIPNMTRLLSTARKREISIVAAIQSLTQLFRVYGDIQGKELQELFKVILISSGLKDSAEYISNILGVENVNNKVKTTKPLMTADEIRRMESDELLIICNNKRPVQDKMMPIFTSADFVH